MPQLASQGVPGAPPKTNPGSKSATATLAAPSSLAKFAKAAKSRIASDSAATEALAAGANLNGQSGLEMLLISGLGQAIVVPPQLDLNLASLGTDVVFRPALAGGAATGLAASPTSGSPAGSANEPTVALSETSLGAVSGTSVPILTPQASSTVTPFAGASGITGTDSANLAAGVGSEPDVSATAAAVLATAPTGSTATIPERQVASSAMPAAGRKAIAAVASAGISSAVVSAVDFGRSATHLSSLEQNRATISHAPTAWNSPQASAATNTAQPFRWSTGTSLGQDGSSSIPAPQASAMAWPQAEAAFGRTIVLPQSAAQPRNDLPAEIVSPSPTVSPRSVITTSSNVLPVSASQVVEARVVAPAGAANLVGDMLSGSTKDRLSVEAESAVVNNGANPGRAGGNTADAETDRGSPEVGGGQSIANSIESRTLSAMSSSNPSANDSGETAVTTSVRVDRVSGLPDEGPASIGRAKHGPASRTWPDVAPPEIALADNALSDIAPGDDGEPNGGVGDEEFTDRASRVESMPVSPLTPLATAGARATSNASALMAADFSVAAPVAAPKIAGPSAGAPEPRESVLPASLAKEPSSVPLQSPQTTATKSVPPPSSSARQTEQSAAPLLGSTKTSSATLPSGVSPNHPLGGGPISNDADAGPTFKTSAEAFSAQAFSMGNGGSNGATLPAGWQEQGSSADPGLGVSQAGGSTPSATPASKPTTSGVDTSDSEALPRSPKYCAAAPTAVAPATPAAISAGSGQTHDAANNPAVILPSPSGGAGSPAMPEKPGGPAELPPAHQMLDSAPVASPGDAQVVSPAGHLPSDAGALQMHLGIHTNAFGNIEIHTVVEQSQVGVSIHGDRDLARWFNSEVGGLETGLKGQHLNLAGVNFSSNRSGVQTATSFQHGHPRQNFPQNAGSYPSGPAGERIAAESVDDSNLTVALPVQGTDKRVSILA